MAFPLLKYQRTHSVEAEFSSVTQYIYSLYSVNQNSLIVHLMSWAAKNGKLAPFKWSFSSASKVHWWISMYKIHPAASEIFKIFCNWRLYSGPPLVEGDPYLHLAMHSQHSSFPLFIFYEMTKARATGQLILHLRPSQQHRHDQRRLFTHIHSKYPQTPYRVSAPGTCWGTPVPQTTWPYGTLELPHYSWIDENPKFNPINTIWEKHNYWV